MKQRFAALLCLLSLAVLTACGGQDASAKTAPAIRPAVFSGDAQQLLDVLNSNEEALAFFDFTADAPIQSVSAEVWKYEDGSWTRAGHVFGNIEPGEYRTGFRVTPSSCEIFEISETGHNTYTYQTAVDFDGCAAVFSTQLGDSQEIVCGEEICLWLKAGSDGGAISGSRQDFRSIGCTAGLAVTMTFSDAPID